MIVHWLALNFFLILDLIFRSHGGCSKCWSSRPRRLLSEHSASRPGPHRLRRSVGLCRAFGLRSRCPLRWPRPICKTLFLILCSDNLEEIAFNDDTALYTVLKDVLSLFTMSFLMEYKASVRNHYKAR